MSCRRTYVLNKAKVKRGNKNKHLFTNIEGKIIVICRNELDLYRNIRKN